jgi:hypothetical protein
MKRLGVVCKVCRNDRVFFGRNEQEVETSIDSSGWIIRPDRNGRTESTCNDCEDWAKRRFGGVKWPARITS